MQSPWIIKAFHNIECRDAILEYDLAEPVVDKNLNPVTTWDGRTMKAHPITGELVPDNASQTPVIRYLNPRKTKWPKVDYIIGNPPFVGNPHMRTILGESYVDAVRQCYVDVPNTSDYVMYWWDKSARLVRESKVLRFGFITTKTLKQPFNRKVVQAHLTFKDPLSLIFAVQNHPWVDSSDGAAVRIAMTVAEKGDKLGRLQVVTREFPGDDGYREVEIAESTGRILPDLRIGPDVAGTQVLRANRGLSNTGVKLHGKGFIVTPEEAMKLGLGKISGLEHHIRHYRNGRDINQSSRGLMVIDLDGLSISDVSSKYPEVYQRVLERVKPERDHNNERYRRENWWLFGRRNTELRASLMGLDRYIATVETSRHRTFTFLGKEILPDNKLIAIGLDDAYFLGVLSSIVHTCWALAVGGNLGEGNDPVYLKTVCFEKFPFPIPTIQNVHHIRRLGDQLDAHRKRQLAFHNKLGLTDMYNVLDKVRTEQPLSAEERIIYDQGLIAVLKQIHDELDAAVLNAYAWPVGSNEDEILSRLVTLNAERYAEEAEGIIRWLRPEFQNPSGHRAAIQGTLIEVIEEDQTKTANTKVKTAWPKTLPERAQAVKAALVAQRTPVTPEQLAKTFLRARVEGVAELLETLASLGQARELDDGRFVGPTIGR